MIDPKEINFSFSMMKYLMVSPYHAVVMKEREKKSSSEQLFALAIECAIQEPERFRNEYHVYTPDKDYAHPKASKHYKQEAAKHEEGKLLTEAEASVISIIRNNAFQNENVEFIYSHGEPQLRLEWRNGKTGVNVKGFADWYCPDLKAIVDLKAVSSASDRALSKVMVDNNFHVQAAIYRWLAEKNSIEVCHSIIIAVEHTFPYQTNIIELSDDQLDIGERIFMEYLELWTYCVENNSFPSYNQDIHQIYFPRWYENIYSREK
jgi:hypothetical protein